MHLSGYAYQAFMFAVIAFALFSGAANGTSIHMNKLVDYFTLLDKRHYTNVAPDEPAGAHADAGVIVFMEGARPDGNRYMSYKRAGSKWCVAPISVDSSYANDLNIQSDIQYWAVGENCCGGHEGFACGDARKPGARSGIVMREMNDLDRKIKGLVATTEMDFYNEAVQMATSKFDLTTPKDHLLVRFVGNVEKAQWDFHSAAWRAWGYTQFWMGFVWAICGTVAMVIARDTYRNHWKDALTNSIHNVNHII